MQGDMLISLYAFLTTGKTYTQQLWVYSIDPSGVHAHERCACTGGRSGH